MKRRMFSKIQNLLHNAVEALVPELPALEGFQFHWKAVTQYFIDTTDERVAVTATDIPMHLEQMMYILQEEDQEHPSGATGPCMEYMLQHKILETMQTLGRADCPPGMKQQVLVFFTNLIGKLKQQVLPHINAHKPISKLIRCCGEIQAAPTEMEEVIFLCVVVSKLKLDPYLVNFFLEVPDTTSDIGIRTTPPGSPVQSERKRPEFGLIDALLELSRSEDSRVAIKACEGLLLCASLPEDAAARVIVLYTAFCERMADHLVSIFRSLPSTMEPSDIATMVVKWGLDIRSDDDNINNFAGRRQLISFLSLLDYVNQLCIESHPMVSKSLGQAIHQHFLLGAIEPGLLQASEPGIITVTALLTKCVKMLDSSTLIKELHAFLLGDHSGREMQGVEGHHKLRNVLIKRIDHLLDQLSHETLKLFEALLGLSYPPILENLVLRNLADRSYLNETAKVTTNGEATENHACSEPEEKERQNGVLATVNERATPATKSSDVVTQTYTDKRQLEKVVNSFLMLLPDGVKSSPISGDSGYDSYLREAHKQCKAKDLLIKGNNWPKTLIPPTERKQSHEFYEGQFLNLLFKRLRKLLDQPYEINLILTCIFATLTQYGHPHLQEYLLDPFLTTSEQTTTLFKILKEVVLDVETRSKRLNSFSAALQRMRKRLGDPKDLPTYSQEETMLSAVIVLEEFCKELAAIAFVRATSRKDAN